MDQIFASYSRRDSKIVDQLINRLEESGYTVWVDREDIRGGSQWRQAIVTAIDNCQVFISLLSPNSIASDNVRKEMDIAEGSKKPILPVMLQQTEIPTHMRYQLAGLQIIDLSQDFETGFSQLVESLGERGVKPTAEPSATKVPRQTRRLDILISNRWVWVIIAVILLVVLSFILSINLKDGWSTSRQTQTASPTPTDTPTPTKTPVPEDRCFGGVVDRGSPFPDIDGWNQEKNYATIHSADINGDEVEDQLGRAPMGMEIWCFDSSQLVWERVATDGPFRDGYWDEAKHYATIHSADIDGDGVDELLGRAPTGIEAWRFDTAWLKWEMVASNGPFLDDEGYAEAKHYATIHSADIDGDGVDELLGRGWNGMYVFRYNADSNGWDMVASEGPFPNGKVWEEAKYYATIHSADINGDGRDELLGRAPTGMEAWRFDTAWLKWEMVASDGPFLDKEGYAEAKYYATIHSADIDDDGVDELLGRGWNGMYVFRYNADSNGWDMVASEGPFTDEFEWHHERNYATIHSADLDGDGRDELMGRAPTGIEVWRFDTARLKWEMVSTVP